MWQMQLISGIMEVANNVGMDNYDTDVYGESESTGVPRTMDMAEYADAMGVPVELISQFNEAMMTNPVIARNTLREMQRRGGADGMNVFSEEDLETNRSFSSAVARKSMANEMAGMGMRYSGLDPFGFNLQTRLMRNRNVAAQTSEAMKRAGQNIARGYAQALRGQISSGSPVMPNLGFTQTNENAGHAETRSRAWGDRWGVG